MFSKRRTINLPTWQAGLLQAQAYRALSNHMTAALAPYELSVPGWALLGLIEESGELRISEAADLMSVKPPVATKMITRLEELGMLMRRDQEGDSRVSIISLTPEGLQRVGEVEGELRKSMRSFLGDIPLAELLIYIRVLRRLAAKI